MRIGENPEKVNNVLSSEAYHRIIIPVYIPNEEGYFKDALKTFKLCLESLLNTIHDKTRITIYNNGCCEAATDYINAQYQNQELIDQVINSKINVGKINAILAGAKGNVEPLLTITDADVLFKNEWQKSVEKLHYDFPEAGMVCPMPSSKGLFSYCANNWYYGLFKGGLRFKDVEDAKGLIMFDQSLGNNKSLLKEIHLKRYLTIANKSNSSCAVMGGGHFVATMKRIVLDKGNNSPTSIKIVGGVENLYIDKPNEDLGLLRIATTKCYVYHMGNVFEDWMLDEYNKTINKNHRLEYYSFENFYPNRTRFFGRKFGVLLQTFLKKNQKFKLFFLNRLGLAYQDY
ncbi:glycosyltransferase [Paucihalobacter sp.]|uniref:glycosyltransferase n=1 Tax=Paucihalobacter sp. TaxID=2850405 RepID=UPI002FE1B632